MENRKRMLWVTNMPAPYRLPILDLLGEKYDLEVYFLLGEENWRNWKLGDRQHPWRGHFLNSRSKIVKEFELILNFGFSIKDLKSFDIIVLGSWENPIYLRLMRKTRQWNKIVIPIYESHSASQKFTSGIVASIRRRFFKRASFVLTFGPASSAAIRGMGISDGSILELFNLVDNSWFQKSLSRSTLELNSGHTYLFVGRLIKIKNVHAAISAFARIANLHDRFRVVGDGPELASLKKLVSDLGIENQVEFFGYVNQSNLVKIYSDSQTLVLPSLIEVWGLVVNEALACGLQVVVSDRAGVASSVMAHRGVYVCAPKVNELTTAMKKSKDEWLGWIDNPEINAFNQDAFVTRLIDRIESLPHD